MKTYKVFLLRIASAAVALCTAVLAVFSCSLLSAVAVGGYALNSPLDAATVFGICAVGDTVKLADNLECNTEQLIISKSITLDLNGKKWSWTAVSAPSSGSENAAAFSLGESITDEAAYPVVISPGKSVTIIDSIGGGALISSATATLSSISVSAKSGTASAGLIYNQGNLTIGSSAAVNSFLLSASAAARDDISTMAYAVNSEASAVCVFCTSGASLSVNGGAVSASSYACGESGAINAASVSSSADAVWLNEDSSLTVNNGSLSSETEISERESARSVTNAQAHSVAVRAQKSSEISVIGGNISAALIGSMIQYSDTTGEAYALGGSETPHVGGGNISVQVNEDAAQVTEYRAIQSGGFLDNDSVRVNATGHSVIAGSPYNGYARVYMKYRYPLMSLYSQYNSSPRMMLDSSCPEAIASPAFSVTGGELYDSYYVPYGSIINAAKGEIPQKRFIHFDSVSFSIVSSNGNVSNEAPVPSSGIPINHGNVYYIYWNYSVEPSTELGSRSALVQDNVTQYDGEAIEPGTDFNLTLFDCDNVTDITSLYKLAGTSVGDRAVTYSYSTDGISYKSGLPTDAGVYTVKANVRTDCIWSAVADKYFNRKSAVLSAEITISPLPVTTVLPSVGTATEGYALETVEIIGGSASTAGEWQWKDGNTVCLSADSGTNRTLQFVPSDSNYSTLSYSLPVSVEAYLVPGEHADFGAGGGQLVTALYKNTSPDIICTPISGYSILATPSRGEYIGTGSLISVNDSLNNEVACYTAVLPGDVNCDGFIDAVDCMLVQLAVSGRFTQNTTDRVFDARTSACDADENGELNIFDLSAVMTAAISD